MIIAHHIVFTTYGTWLPNDPRGAYSDFIRSKKLLKFGDIKHGRQYPQPDKQTQKVFWSKSRKDLQRRPFFINDNIRPALAESFRITTQKLNINVYALAIMNDHVHLVISQTPYKIESFVKMLKGFATRSLQMSVTPWTRGYWNVYITSQHQLFETCEYVKDNPSQSKLPPQNWNFLTPLCNSPI